MVPFRVIGIDLTQIKVVLSAYGGNVTIGAIREVTSHDYHLCVVDNVATQ